jgi:hypothetical protein
MIRDRIFIGKNTVRRKNTGGRMRWGAVERCNIARCMQGGDTR